MRGNTVVFLFMSIVQIEIFKYTYLYCIVFVFTRDVILEIYFNSLKLETI